MTDSARHSARLRSISGLIFVLAATIALSGCAEYRSIKRSLVVPDGDTFYAATMLPLHKKASASSKVVGHLVLHERVTRIRFDSGYALVVVGDGGLEGWVENAKLLRQIPTARAASKPNANKAANATEEPKPAVVDPF